MIFLGLVSSKFSKNYSVYFSSIFTSLDWSPFDGFKVENREIACENTCNTQKSVGALSLWFITNFCGSRDQSQQFFVCYQRWKRTRPIDQYGRPTTYVKLADFHFGRAIL